MIDTKIFNNTKDAFILKTKKDLNRSLFIFRAMSIPLLVPVGIFATKLSLKLKLPVEWLIRRTIFEQFCSGETLEDSMPIVKQMYDKNVRSVLDYSVEGKKTDEEFDKTAQIKIDIVKYASDHIEIPFAVAKPTGLGRFEIWQKVSEKQELTKEEQEEWERIKKRFDKICKTANEHDTDLLIDAEETWMQAAADDLCEEMMARYNKKRAIVYNTLQCYRWDRLTYVKEMHNRAKEGGYKLGFKIVRGAYMEKEKNRALKMGYQSPICENKEATDVNFNTVMSYCIENIEDMAVFIGTHNEVSTYMAMQLMNQKGIDLDDHRIWFGQLYGMSDHISFNIGKECSNAIKLLPFGPIKDVIPYLMRRAQENSSVEGQTSRELGLLVEEKKRREGQFVKHVE